MFWGETPPKYNLVKSYFAIRGGSRKKIAKKIIPRVPTSKNVYTIASIIFNS
jgi:hypothetical protein